MKKPGLAAVLLSWVFSPAVCAMPLFNNGSPVYGAGTSIESHEIATLVQFAQQSNVIQSLGWFGSFAGGPQPTTDVFSLKIYSAEARPQASCGGCIETVPTEVLHQQVLNSVEWLATESQGYLGTLYALSADVEPIALNGDRFFVSIIYESEDGSGTVFAWEPAGMLSSGSWVEAGDGEWLRAAPEPYWFSLQLYDAVGTTPDNPLMPDPHCIANGMCFDFPIGTTPRPGFDAITFVDPPIAIGYDYAMEPDSPNFAGVIIPSGILADVEFDLLVGGQTFSILAGEYFDFEAHFAGGVSAFSIRGIDESLNLDPNDPTAFVTGVRFVSDSPGRMTMTPVTVEVSAVPEPATIGLLAAGLALVAVRRRRLN